MSDPLVSIIMPARNVGDYVSDAIRSALAQTYRNWELLIIENDSHDHTSDVIRTFEDLRVFHYQTDVPGLSNARNIGLKHARGSFICFLDADDQLPPHSISCRLEKFKAETDLAFVDGKVLTYNHNLQELTSTWSPDFEGIPDREMALLIPRCFSGITWMIRREIIGNTMFDTSWTHLEDRLFFLEIAGRGKYGYVNEGIYHIRRRPGSLMTNITALESAYKRFMTHVNRLGILDDQTRAEELYRFHRMFFRTYTKNFRIMRALQHWLYMITKRP